MIPERTVIIVGAGFCGTAVAVNLLRLARRPLNIILLDRAPRIACGTAYSASAFPYLLNVPAGRMSATSVDAEEFLAFAQRRVPNVTAEHFLPRALYGEYLEATLTSAERSATRGVRLTRIHGNAIALEQPPGTLHVHVHLASGRRLTADSAVLALGNPRPASLPCLQPLQHSPGYADDPWSDAAAFRPGETVLVVGTGLTMADVVIAGCQRANGRSDVHAISRHGLLPLAQSAVGAAPDHELATRRLTTAARTTRGLMRAVRTLTADFEVGGGDWREVTTLVRQLAPGLWRRLPDTERRRFLRHVRAYWDVHRHRLPGESVTALDELRRQGRLQVHAGRLLSAERVGERILVSWRVRGTVQREKLLVDRLINATGPDYDARRTRDPLLGSLLGQGTAVPDPLGLGLATAEFGALRDACGRNSSTLFYVGPMLRAAHWEATAVQELRQHAELLAGHLAARMAGISAPLSERGRVRWQQPASEIHCLSPDRPSSPIQPAPA
jgi:uncharacterized NAD(P)/FAD-binding protein YdhS